MNVVAFVVCVVVSLFVERAALTIAYDAAVGRRWQTIAALLAGGMLAAVLAAVSTTVSGVEGVYGFVGFLLLLVIDLRAFGRSPEVTPPAPMSHTVTPPRPTQPEA